MQKKLIPNKPRIQFQNHTLDFWLVYLSRDNKLCELVQVGDAHAQLLRQTDKTLDVGNDNRSENLCVNIDFCPLAPKTTTIGAKFFEFVRYNLQDIY